MALSGEETRQLHEALKSAFPTQESLNVFVGTRLGENRENIAPGSTPSEMVLHLIRWGESCGRLEEVVGKAFLQRRRNQALSQFAENFLSNFEKWQVSSSPVNADLPDPTSDAYIQYDAHLDFLVFDGYEELLLKKNLNGHPRPDREQSIGNVKHWKKIHSLTEELFRKYVEFQFHIIRCRELYLQGRTCWKAADRHRISASDHFSEVVSYRIEHFVNHMRDLPASMSQEIYIKEACKVSHCIVPIQRFLGESCNKTNERKFLMYYALIVSIGNWLLDCLETADLMLEHYFGKHKEGNQ